MHNPHGHIWERLPTESDREFAAFRVYRNLSPFKRTQRAALQVLEDTEEGDIPSIHMIAHWSSKTNWSARARAWDIEQDRVYQQAYLNEKLEAAKRQARMGKKLADIGFKGINAKLEKHEDPEDDYNLSQTNMTALTHAMEAGVRMERTAMGEPIFHQHRQEFIHVSASGNPHAGLENLSLDELKRLADLHRKTLPAPEKSPDITDMDEDAQDAEYTIVPESEDNEPG